MFKIVKNKSPVLASQNMKNDLESAPGLMEMDPKLMF